MTAPSTQRFSELIGSIYDCAIDPECWPEVIREICADLRCIRGAIVLANLLQNQRRFVKTWNFDVSEVLTDAGYSDDIMFHLRSFANLRVGETSAGSRLLSHVPTGPTRYDREVGLPSGHIDSLCTVVANDATHFGLFGLIRHESVGVATDEDLEIMALLAPHIRRAITISDLLDLKTVQSNALSETLDRLAMGVVVVADNNRILHANEAARQMFAHGGPVAATHGRLAARDTTADKELSRAIGIAGNDEAAIGTAGLAVSIAAGDAEPAIAHVLPLATGDLRTRLVPTATAAVFITSAEPQPPRDLSAISQTYKFTPAETRLLQRLAAGDTLNAAADALSVSHTTAKTHLAHIFGKTGMSRQIDLIALVDRLQPPTTSG
jgi:DNA-binding CsgD family transcriptional regulator